MTPKGYSLSIYHFNLQYNAGNEESYHVLITKSFVPFLDFYMANPEFKASCEIQGHAIAFMAKFYPEELEKLVKLVMDRKQIELVSVHYSDQVYLAYPRRDLEESMRVNDETLQRYGLKRGGTFFAQENFFGPGVIPVMNEMGYKVALLNRHYLRHYQGDVSPYPYFERDGIYFLMGGGFREHHKEPLGDAFKDVPELLFDYWGDGELAFTRGNNYLPWHGPSEKKRLKRLYLYRKRHKDGYKTEFCTKYVEILQEMEIKPKPLPLVLDGSWNYPIYGGVYLWMGRYRLWWEQDGYVRSHTYQSRELLLATEALLEKVDDIPWEITKKLKMAWRHLLLAEVSDSTGQTPVLTEVKYSFNESSLCRKYVDEILPWAKKKLGVKKNQKLLIDCGTGAYQPLQHKEMLKLLHENSGEGSSLNELTKVMGNLDISTTNFKKAKFSIRKRPDGDDLDEFYLYLDFKGKPTRFMSQLFGLFRSNGNFGFHETFDRSFSNYVGFTLPLKGSGFTFCPALLEDQPQTVALDDLHVNDTIGKTFLPLPNGMIGIGDDIYLVKHNTYGNMHIAAMVDCRNARAGFVQDGPPSGLKSRWKLSIIKNSNVKKVVARANELNVFPKVIL